MEYLLGLRKSQGVSNSKVAGSPGNENYQVDEHSHPNNHVKVMSSELLSRFIRERLVSDLNTA